VVANEGHRNEVAVKVSADFRHLEKRLCSRCTANPRTATHRWCKPCQAENRRASRARRRIGRVGRPVNYTLSRARPSEQPDASDLIAIIPKHRGEVLGVHVLRFGPRWCVDLRVGYRHSRRGLQPTRRGVAFSVNLLPRIIVALEQARETIGRQAIARGVMGAMAPPRFDPEVWRRQYLE
jgi:hypothetical protein